ncbi:MULTISPECIES: hypothetical protein [unclassified Caballeronia]|uniref:hypothetical protein n=1 Tax=unclassified Caballeronia TaxID=2646786 RepID=UPI001F45E814|nr:MULTISPECIES: hypothetical protein [unclassified Caballeronia]MCE4540917.1 hypothetical protein [Caballeronia sp. PC1]MCE4570040.1 hypothetical protein [Caballeronia sp. CLC5]
MSGAARAQTLRHVGNWTLFALGAATFLMTVYGVVRHFSPVPLADQWDGNVAFFMRAAQNPLAAFFEQHNEHRLVFPRIFFYLDLRYLGGRNFLLIAANLALGGCIGLLLFRIARHHARFPGVRSLGLAGVCLIVAFSWMQGGNFFWGFQLQWFAVYLFALCAFHCMDRCAEFVATREAGRANAWLALALGSAVLSACSMSSGVLVFPVLFALALYRRIGTGRVVVTAAVSAATLFAYFANWHAPASSGGSPLAALREHPVQVLRYFILYLGSPAGQTALGSKGADVAGLIVLVTLLAHCARLLFARGANVPKATSLLAMSLFVASNGFATACGRLSFGLESALAGRYTTASLTCWLALGLFTFLNASNRSGKRLTLVVAMAGVVLVASFERLALRYDAKSIYALDVAGLALRAHVYDPDFLLGAYPVPSALEAIAKQAEPRGLAIFAKDQTDYYVAPARIAAGTACEGKIESIHATGTPGMLVAKGWIFDPHAGAVPRTIVATDADGNVLGTGIAGGKRHDIERVAGRDALYSQWTAFLEAGDAQRVRISGRLRDGTFCSLPEAATTRLAP